MTARFELYHRVKDETRTGLKPGTGQVVAIGTFFPTADGAHTGVAAVDRAAATATIVEG